MFTRAFTTVLFIYTALNVSAQFDASNLLNSGKNILKDSNIPSIKKGLEDRLSKADEDFDNSHYNYAIAFHDDAGLFEVKEKFDLHKKVLIDAMNGDTRYGKKLSNLATHFTVGQIDQKVRSTTEMPLEKVDTLSEEDKELVTKLNKTGEFLYASGQYNKALKTFLKAAALHSTCKDPDSVHYSLVLSNIGLLYHGIGRLTKAQEFTDLSLQMRKELDPLSFDYAVSLNNKGVLAKDVGEYHSATSLLAESLENFESFGSNASVAQSLTLNNLAMLYHTLGRYHEAENFMKRSLSKAESELRTKSANYIKLKTNLAVLYQDQGKYQEAEAIYLEAIKIKQKRLGASHPDFAHLQRNLAGLYMEMGKTGDVVEHLNLAAKIYKKKFGTEHPSYAATAHELGQFYLAQNDLGKASTYLTESFTLRKKLFGEQHPEFINSKEWQAILHWREGKLQQAEQEYQEVITFSLDFIEQYFVSMSEKEKSRFWEKMHPRLDRYFSFCFENYKTLPELKNKLIDLHLNTKGLLLSSSNQIKNTILTSSNSELKRDYKNWLDLKENLARGFTLTEEERKAEGFNLDSLSQACNNLEGKLSKASALFKQGYLSKRKVELNSIQSALNQDQALVDIFEFQRFDTKFGTATIYGYMILNQTGEATLVFNDKGENMDSRFLKFYRNCITNKLDDNLSYDNYWAHISPLTKGKKTIYVSRDGVYHQINLSTLKNPDGQFLQREKTFVYIDHPKDLEQIKKSGTSVAIKTISIIGNPNYQLGNSGEKTIAPLPGTQKELDAITKTLKSAGAKVTSKSGDLATEQEFRKINGEIVHVATHGFFMKDVPTRPAGKVFGIEASTAVQNPLHRCGLMLTGAQNVVNGGPGNKDGIITAYEVSNMDLSSTKLVVLSACETGLGDIKVGEGVYGLQRGLQLAGAKTIIMSLWKVDDNATQMLMSQFYKLLTTTKNKVKAFNLAKQAMMKEYDHPFYWGAFVMINS